MEEFRDLGFMVILTIKMNLEIKKITKKNFLQYGQLISTNDIESKNIAKEIKCSSFEELLKRKPNIIIEAASIEACKDYAETILRNKIDFICLSVCSFADKNFFKKIFSLCKRINNKWQTKCNAKLNKLLFKLVVCFFI